MYIIKFHKYIFPKPSRTVIPPQLPTNLTQFPNPPPTKYMVPVPNHSLLPQIRVMRSNPPQMVIMLSDPTHTPTIQPTAPCSQPPNQVPCPSPP